jgi:hypothetical protein
MKSRKLLTGAALAAMGLGVVGCSSNAGNGALIGGATGAGLGAIIGHQSHGHTAGGAVVGGALGAIGGALVGGAVDEQQQREREVRHRDYDEYSDRPRYYDGGYYEYRTRTYDPYTGYTEYRTYRTYDPPPPGYYYERRYGY